MRLPRLRIRTLMIAVAMVALLYTTYAHELKEGDDGDAIPVGAGTVVLAVFMAWAAATTWVIPIFVKRFGELRRYHKERAKAPSRWSDYLS